MFKIDLKQHSPLIHFQHDRPYATIRATELKSKIDKFIVNDLKIVDPTLYKEYSDLITSENFPMKQDDNISSKYKIRVLAPSGVTLKIKYATRPGNDLHNDIPNFYVRFPAPYFADNQAVFNDKVSILIFSFNRKLIGLLEKSIPYVLVYNNFGMRQSKGFGSFLPKNMTIKEMHNIILKKYSAYYIKTVDTEPFKSIYHDYKVLKSGRSVKEPDINNNRLYVKSDLFEYFCKKNIRWEKRKIKEAIESFNRTNPGKAVSLKAEHAPADCPSVDRDKFRFVRALLGLADRNEYLISDPSNPAQALRNEKVVLKIKDKNEEIDRFRSPILFKIYTENKNSNGYKYSIIILPENIPDVIYDRWFRFSLCKLTQSGPTRCEEELDNCLFELKTPAQTEFVLTDFLDTYLPPKSWSKKVKS
jgi:hypothetical protein